MKSLLITVTLLSALTGEVHGVDLTKDNFKSTIAGKNAFVKFFAPWCGHCKALKPTWDELIEMYATSSSVLIGDADCTNPDTEGLCQDFGVGGYPTLKYFVDGDEKGADYKGGRDMDSLKSFIESTLEVKCNPADMSECSEKEQAYITKMKAASAEDRKKQLTRLEKMAGDSMKLELKKWLHQRLHILNNLP